MAFDDLDEFELLPYVTSLTALRSARMLRMPCHSLWQQPNLKVLLARSRTLAVLECVVSVSQTVEQRSQSLKRENASSPLLLPF